MIAEAVEKRVTTVSFYYWVERYNYRVERQGKLMESLALWEKNLLTRAVGNWRRGVRERKRRREGLRSMWSARFVMRLLNSGVPKQVVQQYKSFEEELRTPLSVIPLKRIDEDAIEATVLRYDKEMTRRLFLHWRHWYENIRNLK